MNRRSLFLTLLSTALFFNGIAAPHNGEQFELSQPDGSTVPVVVWGDEFYQRVETPDGFTLIRNNETGWICYAKLAPDSSELIPTDRTYQTGKGLAKSIGSSYENLQQHVQLSRNARLIEHRQVRQRLLGEDRGTGGAQLFPASPSSIGDSSGIMPLQGAKPVTGSFTGLTILIDFSDKQASVPIDSIKDFVNKRGYTGFKNNGSVRDFYYDVSGGKVDYQNIVVGYYRAAKEKSYYDSRSASFGDRAQELILEALNWLKKDGFDFSVLSTYASASSTSRKNIRAINILYAGSPSQGWSEGLWPHQGRLSSSISLSGVYAAKYQMSNIGSSLKLGTFCHENGHMLFSWPDLYDYGGESGGVGVYCLMCNTGTTNPIPPCVYLRDYAGWVVATDVTNMALGTVLTQLPADISTTFMFRNKSNEKEMFYIEARRRAGRYKTLPDSGFMIWHVDQNGSNDNERGTSTSHYLVALEQADNAFHLENGSNSGKAGDLFRKGYKDRFSDTTKPDAHWWSGSNSGMKIFNMSGVADTMSFSIGEIAGTLYTIFASAGEHGSLNPSGKISAVAGSTLKFAIRPDSGYQIDAITMDDATVAIVDTVLLDKISGDHTIKVVFGPKGALSVVFPEEGDVLYAGDSAAITWRTRGVTVQGIDVSYSIDGGKTFSAVKSGLPATDSVLRWVVPVVESDSCIFKVADTDGNPSARSGLFVIKKKPSIAVAADQLTLTVECGTSTQQTFSIENKGTGDLRLSATTALQVDKIIINELSVGADADAPDAIELLNDGVDIDLSGWQLLWDDNKSTSGSYTFPNGFVFKGGTTFVIDDVQNDTTAVSVYMGSNVQWLFSDSLALAVTLLDAAGRGVDFVKSSHSPIMSPEGTAWLGSGIELCSAYVARVGSTDRDSAVDWSCTAAGSLKRLNAAQKAPSVPPLLVTAPLTATAAGGNKVSLTITIDATGMQAGDYTDMLVIYHNDPDTVSPVRIPCIIKVTTQSKVITTRSRSDHLQASGVSFIAAPNPVPPGERVFFHYQPAGDERSGHLMIYNSVGDCIYTDEINFSRVNVFNKQPLRFSWLPMSNSGKAYRRGTCLARLIVKRGDGSRVLFSTKIGLR
ncbi:MAG: M6 family metalloprotease domain-containing protein [Chitinispirillaceae bacterium]|nr:M6 family metalloprotease domain-containing protein [Chitinispirillaceae bacterium]